MPTLRTWRWRALRTAQFQPLAAYLLTLFTIPKAFHGPFELIQTNAIASWTRLDPACQIILLGNEAGTAELARRLGIDHIPEVPCSEFGTPLVSGLFSTAEQHARHEVMCYVNADIILMADFAAAVRRVMFGSKPSMMAGRRWNTPVDFPLDFNDDWQSRLRRHVAQCGKRFIAGAIDYFVYPKGQLGTLPPFAIGRTVYDTWLLYHALRCGLRLVDATRCVTAVHQDHDYSHAAGGFKSVWEGPEAQRNKELSGGPRYWYNLYNARWVLTRWGLWPALSYQHIRRRIICPI